MLTCRMLLPSAAGAAKWHLSVRAMEAGWDKDEAGDRIGSRDLVMRRPAGWRVALRSPPLASGGRAHISRVANRRSTPMAKASDKAAIQPTRNDVPSNAKQVSIQTLQGCLVDTVDLYNA